MSNFSFVSTVGFIASLIFAAYFIWPVRKIAIGQKFYDPRESSSNPEVKLALRSRRIRGVISIAAVLLFGVTLFLASEDEKQNRQAELLDLTATIQEDAAELLVDPLSAEDIRALIRGEQLDLRVVSFDGVSHVIPFSYGAPSILFSNRGFIAGEPLQLIPDRAGVPGSGTVMAKGQLLGISAYSQRSWETTASAVDSIKEDYGILLTGEQVQGLRVPPVAPTELTSYGTIPLTITLEADGYSMLDATLIWDGKFKLIGSIDGGVSMEELPRTPGKD